MHESFYRVEINPIAAEIFPTWPKEIHGAKILIWQNIHTDHHTFALCGSQNKKLWRIRVSACSTAYWIIPHFKTCIHAVYLQLMIALGLNNNTRSNKGHTKLACPHPVCRSSVGLCACPSYAAATVRLRWKRGSHHQWSGEWGGWKLSMHALDHIDVSITAPAALTCGAVALCVFVRRWS